MESSEGYGISRAELNPLQGRDLGGLSPEVALHEFSSRVLSEEACRLWILQRLHPAGAFCPNCQTALKRRAELSFWEGKRTYCKFCEKQFSVTTGTILANISMNMREVFLLLVLIAMKVDKKEIARILNIHPDSVKNWEKRLNING